MPRDYKLYLEDMLDSAQWLRETATGQPLERYFNDRMFRDAVVHNLEIIGEAAKHIPAEVRQQYSDIEWRKIAGLRDRVAHEYLGLHLETLKSAVDVNITNLTQQLQFMLEGFSRSES